MNYPEVATFLEAPTARLLWSEDRPPPRIPPLETRTVQPNVDRRLRRAPPEGHRRRAILLEGAHVISPAGVILDAEGHLVFESLWDRNQWSRDLDPPPPLPPHQTLRGRYASLLSLWANDNYYHWLFDALPRYSILERLSVDVDGFLVPPNLSRFQLDTLARLGVEADALVPLDPPHLQIEELIWLSPLDPIGFASSETVSWLRGKLGQPGSGGSRRLYLQRRHARRVANEREVLDYLTERGFEVADPAGLSFDEQVQLFADTAAIVGPHGAAFGNAIFSASLTAVEFYAPQHVNTSTLAACNAAGHKHWHLMCPRVVLVGRRRGDVKVPLRQLAATLDAAGID